MKEHADLFGNETAAAPAASPSAPTGIALRLGARDANLSPAQKRFNTLVARIGKLKGQIADVDALANVYRPLFEATLGPLQRERQAHMRNMALRLDERLQGKGLSLAQKRTATEVLCMLSGSLASDGDEAMRALHDKHSSYSFEEQQQAAAADIRAMMEDVLGQAIAADEALDSVDAVVRAGMAQAREAERAAQAKRSAARAKKGPTAAQRKAELQQADAETILRKVYRQLASALHPDRERDASEQQRKTALMSEANAAYGRQDLMALLQIQLRIEQADPQSLSQLPEDKIKSMSLLLQQQAAELEQELDGHERRIQHDLNLSPYRKPSVTILRAELHLQQRALEQDLAQMEQDLQTIEDEAGFKRWVKVQKRLLKESALFEGDEFGF